MGSKDCSDHVVLGPSVGKNKKLGVRYDADGETSTCIVHEVEKSPQVSTKSLYLAPMMRMVMSTTSYEEALLILALPGQTLKPSVATGHALSGRKGERKKRKPQ